jgi:VanZ family protein
LNNPASPDPQAKNFYRTIGWTAAVIVCAAVIFVFSTRGFSIELSLRLLGGTLRFFGLGLCPEDLFYLDRIVRKLVHVMEFALLTSALYYTLRPSAKHGWHARSGLVSMVGSALYAASDELHQLYVPGRNGSVRDWFIDMAGVLLAISAAYLWARLFPQDRTRRATSRHRTAENSKRTAGG